MKKFAVGNKVVLTESHWGLESGTIATVTKIPDQITAHIRTPNLSGARPVPLASVRRATKNDF